MQKPKIVPMHQRQRIAHCDTHLFPPHSGFVANLTHLNIDFRPVANLPAASRTRLRSLYRNTPNR
jgi:hypothetical protein